MKHALALLLACLAGPLAAQPRFDLARIATPADPAAIALYPAGSLPPAAAVERWGMLDGRFPDGTTVHGRIARNVSAPTITPVLPDPARATGAAVVVAPGGAFLSLSMDTEGFDIARRLAAQGIAAFVLKYRTNPMPDAEPAFMAEVGRVMAEAARPGGAHALTSATAADDALRALAIVRARAAAWTVDPKRVGLIGFSAGAQTAMLAVQKAPAGTGPAFFGYIYGPMEAIPVPADAPPMFAALALDDPLFGHQGFGVVEAWQKAARPVELHAYERGDHGFGAGRAGTTSTGMIPEFVAWLSSRGIVPRARP